MKTEIELEMERTQAELRRLKRELEAAQHRADRAWAAYVREPAKLMQAEPPAIADKTK